MCSACMNCPSCLIFGLQNLQPCLWSSDDGRRLGTYEGHNGAIWSCDITCEFVIQMHICPQASHPAAKIVGYCCNVAVASVCWCFLSQSQNHAMFDQQISQTLQQSRIQQHGLLRELLVENWKAIQHTDACPSTLCGVLFGHTSAPTPMIWVVFRSSTTLFASLQPALLCIVARSSDHQHYL